METANRPPLDKNLAAESFRAYYWLKEELVRFCREVGINSGGGKRDIADRISKFLETGEIVTKQKRQNPKTTSRFDWNRETLTLDTIITNSYKNTENVRAFFQQEIGNHFKFNTLFMKWMKENQGKTLGAAITEWQRINELKKSKTYQTEIAPQFEYNRYIRDFHINNPGLSTKDAIRCWHVKRSKPGSNHYEDTDILFLKAISI